MIPAAGLQVTPRRPAAGRGFVPSTDDLDRGLEGIGYLLQTQIITVQQYEVMVARRVARAVTGVLPDPVSPQQRALGTRLGHAGPGSPSGRAGEPTAAGPDQLLARIRALTELQCRDALLWLSGYTPRGTELALLAAMTPMGNLATGGIR